MAARRGVRALVLRPIMSVVVNMPEAIFQPSVSCPDAERRGCAATVRSDSRPARGAAHPQQQDDRHHQQPRVSPPHAAQAELVAEREHIASGSRAVVAEQVGERSCMRRPCRAARRRPRPVSRPTAVNAAASGRICAAAAITDARCVQPRQVTAQHGERERENDITPMPAISATRTAVRMAATSPAPIRCRRARWRPSTGPAAT